MRYMERQCKTCEYKNEAWDFKVCDECGYGGTNYEYEPIETEGEGDNIKYL